nr:NifU family protein [uncultured Anaerostipes sp.]
MLQTIEEVLDNKVRPKLLEHEGDVEAVEYKEGILKVRLLGQCAGCPSAQLTTEELISDVICSEIPEVKEVVLVHEVSPDLLDMARNILNRRHTSEDSYESRN